MENIEPVTRKEMYLNNMATGSGNVPSKPITRTEMFLAKAIGQDVNTPTPVTREELYLANISGGGGDKKSSFGSVEQMTVATECNWYAIWQAFQYKLKYQKSSILMVCLSPDVAQTGSNYTNFAYNIAHNGTTVISPKENRWYYQQKAQKVAPNSGAFRFDRYTADWYYGEVATISADGSITAPSAESNTVMVPAGARIYLFEFPRDYQNGEIDMTPFGD